MSLTSEVSWMHLRMMKLVTRIWGERSELRSKASFHKTFLLCSSLSLSPLLEAGTEQKVLRVEEDKS